MKKLSILIVLIIILIGIMSLVGNKPSETKNVSEVATTTNTTVTKVTIPDGIYIADKEKSTLTWTGKKKILKNWIDKGSIKIKDSTVEIKSGEIVSNKISIDMRSVTASQTGSGSGFDKVATHLMSTDFFDAEKYPEATFVAKEVSTDPSKTDSQSYIAKGDLTIKDITNEISIPVTVTKASSTDEIIVKGLAEVDRTLWNIKYGSDKFFQNLGDNVIDDIFELEFKIVAKTI